MLDEKDLLSYVLRNYCNVNARDERWIAAIQAFVRHDAEREARFEAELTAAIENGTLSTTEFERLTGEDFDTHQQLVNWLRDFRDQVLGRN